MGYQFHFDPATYLDLMAAEVPSYERLQAEVAGATVGVQAGRILDLGAGMGETARRVLDLHPGASLVGVDVSPAMLAYAARALPAADFRVGALEDQLPAGTFDLVVSALAVHHLDGPGKADLFVRVARVLGAGGRFVLGDVVVPRDPADVVTPIDGDRDRPSSIDEQLGWLADAGLRARLAWSERDLAVLVGE